MATKTPPIPGDFIHPLNMNGLRGRMLRMPAPARKNREILIVYGHHSSLERWWGVIQDFNQYGAITVPDLPGFGGMDSFYKIGEKPTLDNYADYLAAFIKLRYKRRRLTIIGLSFGFVVATRMLQRYPDLAKKVDVLISVVGFAHRDDFTFTKPQYYGLRAISALFSHRLPAAFFRHICLNPLVLRRIYDRVHYEKTKFATHTKEQHKELINFEIYLWHCNEVRTYMYTTSEFLKLDNCKKQIDLPVWHVSVKADQYFDNHMVEQHFRVIFSDYHEAKSKLPAHAPSVIADIRAAAPFIPPKIRRLLSRT